MKKIAVYPGTFDPITNGHMDIVKRASDLFDHVIVAVADNPRKQPCFTTAERLSMALDALVLFKNIEVCSFSCLLVNFAKQKNAKIIIRGIRALSDFEYEFQMASINRCLAANIETVFLTPLEQYANLSSSMVREVAQLGGDVSLFVPDTVATVLKKTVKKTWP